MSPTPASSRSRGLVSSSNSAAVRMPLSITISRTVLPSSRAARAISVRLVVADALDQGRQHGRRAVRRARRQRGLVGLDARRRRAVGRSRTRRSAGPGCPAGSRPPAAGTALSSRLPIATACAMAWSLAITTIAAWLTASGMTGLTLPGMIDEPACRCGQADLAQPAVGPAGQQPQVAGDLQQVASPGP